MIIYKVTNLINNKIYIGKTVQTLSLRKNGHKSSAINHKDNSYFHKAIRKYGIENFKWEEIDYSESEADLNEKEKYWILEYSKICKTYNLTKGGEGVSGLRHSEDSKLKMSQNMKGRRPWNTGLKHSEESKLKMSNSRRGITFGEDNPFYGKKHTDESLKKMSKSRKGIPNLKLRGRIITEETRKKLSDSHKGKTSPNKGKKIPNGSLAKMGEKNPMYGFVYSEEKRKIMSERISGDKNYFFGKKHSEETKFKMRETKRLNKLKREAELERLF